MTQTMSPQDITGQVEIGPNALRFGDYFRIEGHRTNVTEWLKVTDTDDFLIVAVTESRVVQAWTHTTLQVGGGYKLYLHPYSLKHNR